MKMTKDSVVGASSGRGNKKLTVEDLLGTPLAPSQTTQMEPGALAALTHGTPLKPQISASNILRAGQNEKRRGILQKHAT